MKYSFHNQSISYQEPFHPGDVIDPSKPINQSSIDFGEFSNLVQVFKEGDKFYIIYHVSLRDEAAWHALEPKLWNIWRKCPNAYVVTNVFFGSNEYGHAGYYQFSDRDEIVDNLNRSYHLEKVKSDQFVGFFNRWDIFNVVLWRM